MPGRWTPVYATPLEVSRLRKNVDVIDGWLTPKPQIKRKIALPPFNPTGGSNWGGRAAYRWSTESGARASVSLRIMREMGDIESTLYMLEVTSSQAAFYFCTTDPEGNRENRLIGKPMPLDLKDGQTVKIEGCLVGFTLLGKVNGEIFTCETKGELDRGFFEVACYQMAFRDLEFINLDGLSNEDARRAAGFP